LIFASSGGDALMVTTGFQEGGIHVSDGGSEVVIDKWPPDLAGVLARPGRKALRITNTWPDDTLDRLMPFRDQIDSIIVEADIPDLSALSTFSRLRALSISGFAAIDFAALPLLETLRLSGHFGNLGRCDSLRVLSIDGGGLSDLRALAGLDQLAELEVAGTPLRSLAGLEMLKSLRRLSLFDLPLPNIDGLEQATSLSQIGLHRLGRLRSIAPLAALSGLKMLEIDGSKKITDLERLGDTVGMEDLKLTGTPLSSVEFLSRLRLLRFLTLHNVGRLPSLAFLGSLDKLETLALAENTVVENGDLSVLLTMPALRIVSFTQRRHYSHHLDGVQAVLTERGTLGPGSFDNYMSRQWAALLQTRNHQLGRMMVGSVLRDTLTYGEQEIPARLGQYAIGAAEVLARLRGYHRERTPHSAPVDQWVVDHSFEPNPETVALAVETLDRLLRAPSGLLTLWMKRGQAEAWIEAVNDLRSRLTRGAQSTGASS